MFAQRTESVSVLSAWIGHFYERNPIVSIAQGELQGSLETLENGSTYASFKGIPYAKPPIGDARFKNPLPPDKWIGILDATKHGPICPQYDMATVKILEGSEDCLFLNVYTPSLNSNLVPVMVYFHGGGFQSGSGNSDTLGPDYLIEEGVVLVTVNYRLEALGLLCMDTEEVPGNAGLKDQTMALRWVKHNITAFGGNADNVTIFGESAGGVSTTYHMISPMSRGLFHKVIAQSGTMFVDWAISYENVERAFRLGKYLGIETDDVNELLQYLRSVPSSKLIKVNYNILTAEEKNRGFPIYLCPVIEKSFNGQEAFLPEAPIKLIEEGKFANVPVLLGYNSAEGMILSKNILMNPNENLSRNMSRDISRYVSPERLHEIGNEARNFYFGKKPITPEVFQQIVDFESDNHFTMGIQKFARIMAKKSKCPVFLYRFSFDGEVNKVKWSYSKLGTAKGACHVDDLYYIFKTPLNITKGSESWRTMKRMTKMWTNFAKYGNPTPVIDDLIPIQWKSITPDEINFMEIDTEIKSGVEPDKERYEFWKHIYNTISSDDSVKFV